MTPEEEWRPVVGWESTHEVSSLGRVRRLDRWVKHPSGKRVFSPGHVMSGSVKGHIYRRVGLAVDRYERTVYVHQIVAAAFLGPRPRGLEVCHGNGNPLDNRVENLRYDTPSENSYDTVRHGNNLNKRKTHCKHGHEFTPENTGAMPGGNRYCKTCKRRITKAAKQRAKARRKAAA